MGARVQFRARQNNVISWFVLKEAILGFCELKMFK
jgi:hypothetical protein